VFWNQNRDITKHKVEQGKKLMC